MPQNLSLSDLLQETEHKAVLLDSEDVLARIDMLEWLQQHSPYSYAPTDSYWSRINTALQFIHKRHHDAAIALFSRVVYLDSKLLDATTRQLVHDVGDWCVTNGLAKPLEDTFIFAVDHPDLIRAFYDYGSDFGWVGRADNKLQSHIQTATQLIGKLLDCKKGQTETIEMLRRIFSRKLWIVITDNAMGGGSAASELLKLRELARMFGQENGGPGIIFATQTYSDLGASRITPIIPADRIAYGIRFGNHWRISDSHCRLFSPEVFRKVAIFCRWFGEECIGRDYSKAEEYPFLATLHVHRRTGHYDTNFSFGWFDSGFTVITHKNSPTNSVPALWYPCKDEKVAPPLGLFPPTIDMGSGNGDNQSDDLLAGYKPPFPRNSSRKIQNTAGDQKKIEQLRQSVRRIRSLLWSH